MKRNLFVLACATLLFGVWTASPVGAQWLKAPKLERAGDIPYISGGVGQEERASLEERAGDYSLKLVFAERSGNFLAGVRVVVRDMKGANIVQTVTRGPFLYVDFPKGTYRLEAMHDDVTRVREFQIGSGQTSLVIGWPDG